MALPPVRCRATSKRSHRQCQRFCPPGGVVCAMHGGSAPQVQARAMERAILADALLHNDRRDPHEVIEDAVNTMDQIKQWLTAQITHGDDRRPMDLERLIDSVDRSMKYAKIAIDVGVEERKVRVSEQLGAQMALVLRSVFAGLQLTPEQQALIPSLMKAASSQLQIES